MDVNSPDSSVARGRSIDPERYPYYPRSHFSDMRVMGGDNLSRGLSGPGSLARIRRKPGGPAGLVIG